MQTQPKAETHGNFKMCKSAVLVLFCPCYALVLLLMKRKQNASDFVNTVFVIFKTDMNIVPFYCRRDKAFVLNLFKSPLPKLEFLMFMTLMEQVSKNNRDMRKRREMDRAREGAKHTEYRERSGHRDKRRETERQKNREMRWR